MILYLQVMPAYIKRERLSCSPQSFSSTPSPSQALKRPWSTYRGYDMGEMIEAERSGLNLGLGKTGKALLIT